MKKILMLIYGITFISNISVGQTVTLPYVAGFDNASQLAGWVEYADAGTMTGGWQVVNMNAYSPAYATYQIYSTSENLDNWLVSPGFMIPSGGTLDSIRYMFDGLSVPGTNDTIALYLLHGSQNPLLASKTLLFDIRGANYVNDAAYRKKSNLNLPAGTGLSYFAIRFKCTQEIWLETYFDNISISANQTAPAPVTSFSASSGTVCTGKSIAFHDLSTGSPTSWNWHFAGGTPSTSSLSAPSVTYSSPGTYTVSLVSSNATGAGNTYTATVVISACTGIDDLQNDENKVLVYPNPNTGKFTITFTTNELKEIELYTVLGEKILMDKTDDQTKSRSIDIENQPAGIYFLRIGDGIYQKTIRLIKY